MCARAHARARAHTHTNTLVFCSEMQLSYLEIVAFDLEGQEDSFCPSIEANPFSAVYSMIYNVFHSGYCEHIILAPL